MLSHGRAWVWVVRSARRPSSLRLHPERTYVPDLDADARNRMLARYREHGFLNASIAEPPVRRVRDVLNRPAFEVTFAVTEGPRTLLDEIAFEGNAAIPSAVLATQTDLRLGVPLSFAAVERARTLLTDFYRERAYLFVRVDYSPNSGPPIARARGCAS